MSKRKQQLKMKSLLQSPTKTNLLPKSLAMSAFLRRKTENQGVWNFGVSTSEVICLEIPHLPLREGNLA